MSQETLNQPLLLKPIRVKKASNKKTSRKIADKEIKGLGELIAQQNLKALFLEAFIKLSPEEFKALTKSYKELDSKFKDRTDRDAINFIKIRTALITALAEVNAKFGDNPKLSECGMLGSNT